jgi:hypothetical protein
MNATAHIQSRIATNAARITAMNAQKEQHVDNARSQRAKGELSFAADQFDKADKLASKLRKLHTTQKALYVELKAGYTRMRITAKAKMLAAAGWTMASIPRGLTTFEVEAALDALIARIKQKVA